MFFCKANVQNAQILNQILATYALVSGQLINTQKSAVLFSKNSKLEVKTQVKLTLGIENSGGFGKYLGLSEQFGRRKREGFAFIVDRIKRRAISWSSKFLSRAGKMVMLLSVLSAVPSHAMSFFELPQALCDQIQSLLTRFWWDTTQDKRIMSWISWKKMAKQKKIRWAGFQRYCYLQWCSPSWTQLENSKEPLLSPCSLPVGKTLQGRTFFISSSI